jgi:hypothetical protein
MSTTTISNINHKQVELQVDLQALKHGAGLVTLTGADLVGSIDQGTSSTRFLVFTAAGIIAASAQMEHQQIYPEGEDKVCTHVVLYDCLFGCHAYFVSEIRIEASILAFFRSHGLIFVCFI